MSNDDTAISVQNNAAEQRYEVRIGDALAELTYQRTGDVITFLHTGVPAALEGRGIGGKLAQTALDDARAQHLTVVPLCPFVAAYIQRHPAYLDLVSATERQRLQQQ